jgi:hypothetical protein
MEKMLTIVPTSKNLSKDKILSFKKDKTKMLSKLKKLVIQQQSFEEESMLYNYKGKDKNLIWSCMEFFYENLWTKEFREFIYTDDKDEWENYHIQLKCKNKFTEVTIVYGIGAFCVIAPLDKPTDKSKILDLDKVIIGDTEIFYDS